MTSSAASPGSRRAAALRRTKRKPWFVVALTVVGVAATHAVGHARGLPGPWIAVVAALAALGLILRYRSRAPKVAAKDRYAPDDAGIPYELEVSRRKGDGKPRRMLVVTDVALEFDVSSSPGISALLGENDLPDDIPLGDVHEVRVVADRVTVLHRAADALKSLDLFPSKDDRDRLLWELALRCPEAVERGLPPPA